MKVLIVCNDTAYFMRHRKALADALHARGDEVTVMAGGPKAALDTDLRWRFQHVPVDRFKLSRHDVKLFARVLRAIRNDAPKAMQLITLKPAIFGGLAVAASRLFWRAPERVVVTIPGLGRLMSPESPMTGLLPTLARSLIGATMRFLARDARFVFTFETSHDRDSWVQAGIAPAKRAFVINGAGVDDDRFHPPATRDESRPLTVLFASRLLRSKGLDTVMDVAHALKHFTGVRFLIAGMADHGDPDNYSVEALRSDQAITFLGDEKDMPALLRTADVVCLPTHYGEGVPRILIEAAATGLPCIAGDVFGCREIVEDGKTGVLVAPRPADVAARQVEQAILAYANDRGLALRHGDAALERFRNGGFAESKVIGVFLDLLSTPATDRSKSTIRPD